MIGDIRSIQQEGVGIGPAPVDVESRPRAKVKRNAGLPRAHAYDARLQESELVITSAVQRQVSNGSVVHQRAHGGSGRFHQRRFRGDRDRLGSLSYPESEVDHLLAAHREDNSASDLRLKASLLASYFIIAHRQNGNDVTAPLVARETSESSRIHVPDGDHRSGDDGSRGILHDPGTCPRAQLRKQREREQQHTQTCTEHVNGFSGSGHLHKGIHSTPIFESSEKASEPWTGPRLVPSYSAPR